MLKDGVGVCISKCTRLGSFEIQIDVTAAVWVLEILQEILVADDNKPFFRKYRSSNSLLIAERYSNWKGVFLKFSKLVNDSLKNIIVLGGSSKWGWTRMAVCLDNLVGKRFWGSKGGFRKGVNYDASSFIQARKLGRNMQEFTKILMSIKGCSLDSKRKRCDARGSLAGLHSVNVPKRN